MNILQLLKNYSARLLKVWIFWFWFFALDALGLVVDTFVPAFSTPHWLYILIATLGFIIANVKLFAEDESEKQVLQGHVAQLEALYTTPLARVRKYFEQTASQMPKLLAEMKRHLKNSQFVREFFLVKKKWVMNYGETLRFVYYYEDHDNLDGKIQVLENRGFVVDITTTTTKKYRMTEEFVELLLADGPLSET